MARSEIFEVVLAHLNKTGRALKTDHASLVGGDEVRFECIRDELLIEGLAYDEIDGVLTCIPPSEANRDAKAGYRAIEEKTDKTPSRRLFLSYGH